LFRLGVLGSAELDSNIASSFSLTKTTQSSASSAPSAVALPKLAEKKPKGTLRAQQNTVTQLTHFGGY